MDKIKVNFVPMDDKACGYYRVLNIAELLYCDSEFLTTVSPVGSFHYYGQDYFFTQRVAGNNNMETLLKIKEQTKVKFIIDYDDIVWEQLPSYNLCPIKWKDNYDSMKKYLNQLADKIVCTTDYLKESLSQFVDSNKIYVIPNMLPRHKWFQSRNNRPVTDNILYAGSPTHFDNSRHQYGDFTIEWDKFLKDKKLNIMGIAPWFVNPINIYGWTDMLSYQRNFYKIASMNKYVIAPLCDNHFNQCKSDLKYLECCAVGRVCICTDFDGSPYRYANEIQKVPIKVTSKQLDYCIEQCNEHYEQIIQYQYDYLNSRWLEDNIDLYKKLFKESVNRI